MPGISTNTLLVVVTLDMQFRAAFPVLGRPRSLYPGVEYLAVLPGASASLPGEEAHCES